MLNKYQQQLVKDNHNLIYEYAYRHNLDIDEYYDLLAIGLCSAAKCYDSTKSKFSTLASKCIENVLKDYYKQNKHNIPTISYDTYTDENDDLTLFDTISDEKNIEDFILSDMVVKNILSKLTKKERIIIKCLLKGMTHRQIALKLSCTRQNVSYIINDILKKKIFFQHY